MVVLAAVSARVLLRTRENRAPARRHVATTVLLPYAESPRTRIWRGTPAARAVFTAWAIMRAAPLPELVRPARNRGPAITGAACSVLIVVISGDSPLRRICLPAILVCPYDAPCLACP